jgi:hypothetical protein
MKHEAVKVAAPRAYPEGGAPAMLETKLDAGRGFILECTLRLPEADAPQRGLYIQCSGGRGAAVLLDSSGKAQLGEMKADGSGFNAAMTVDREMSFGETARFRLILKRRLMECYLDDILIECFTLPGSATGKLGVIGGKGVCTRPRAWY